MTTWAWGFMFAAWSVIIGCMVYCFARLLFSPRGLQDQEMTDVPSAPRAGTTKNSS